MSCFSQSVSMAKRNNIVLLKNNSIFQTKVRKWFLADRRQKIINRVVDEVCKCLRSARTLS
jgi:hypothetical protein